MNEDDEWDWYEDELAGLDLEEQLDALLRPVPQRPYASAHVAPAVKPEQAPGAVIRPGEKQEPRR